MWTVNAARREAFEALCRDEYAAVVRTAWLIVGDREEALDLAQETFARTVERWRTVEGLDRPGAWLQRVVGNLALTALRKSKRRADQDLPDLPAAPMDAPDPELMDAMRALPPAQRTAIVLRYYADLSVEDTAASLGKRPGTVRALTSQGVQRLRELMTVAEVRDE
jgi:RNA polymerase sigma-70 factor (sigma-E family)